MCGISGVILKENKQDLNKLIRQMNDLIAHRGPDGDGEFFDDKFAFGHRRLSIIDLSSGGDQPMKRGEDYVLTFNGEIYNYIELRDELKVLGCQFSTASDTEVILAAYEKWGEDCVKKFNGMWSFAIFDKQKNSIFCSRDRFGIKPFYFLAKPEAFYFGSEIKQLLPFVNVVRANESILLEYLITGIEEHDNQTFFQEVQKLLGGHNLIFSLEDFSFEIKQFYTIGTSETVSAFNEDAAVEAYQSDLNNAIKLRMRSDVKVGTCLSGGLDSSSVAAISSSIYNEDNDSKFIAIHAKSTEKESDESQMAQQVAEHCNIDLHLIEPSETEFKGLIDEVIYTQEEPFGGPSIFMQYLVMKKARSLNCKVMLDGQGGDETLLGYEKYYPAYILGEKGSGKFKAFWNSSKNSKLSKLDVIKYFVYFTRYKTRINRLKKKAGFVKKEYLTQFESEILTTLSANYLNIQSLQRLEMTNTQLPHLLKYEDKNSMRNSIETRLPFIDYRVVETALAVNNNYKIKDGWSKYLLRKTVDKLLPKQIVWRKNKLGFNAPTKTWLNGIESDMERAILSSKLLQKYLDQEKLVFSQIGLKQKWRLYNVAKWEEIYQIKVG